jgi:glycosyltransferase involved in cell wall biosynthesis
MRVLWFSVTPSMYGKNNTSHNGGGWISSLEELVRNEKSIELGIAFEFNDTSFKVVRDNVYYYPLYLWKSKLQKIKKKLFFSEEEKRIIPACLKIIEDFKPDIIHVFGSEWSFGLINQFISIPVIIHMQGSIPPYFNARFPAGFGKCNFILYNGINLLKTIKQYRADLFFKLRSAREERILKTCKYYMGRTEWDKSLTRLYAPDSLYFYCSESLRAPFINSCKIWKKQKRENIIFVSTISSPLYKGSDLILKTAKLLKENTQINFEWKIIGINDILIHEKLTKIRAGNVNVKLLGTLSADSLIDELLDSDIFIHPSYIDNSPNSVCEAQYLGVPVISTDVGGISSLIKNEETGFLVPSNDPYMMASKIITLIKDESIARSTGLKGSEIAKERHSQQKILTDLKNIYNKVFLSNMNKPNS